MTVTREGTLGKDWDAVARAINERMTRLGLSAAELTSRAADEPRLESEIVVSALIGISLGRALGWFDELMAAPKVHLVDLVTELLDNG